MKQLLTRGTALERTIGRLLGLVRDTLYAERSVAADGLLQRLDPRAKLVGAFSLLVAASASYRLRAVLTILLLTAVLAALSRVSAAAVARSLFLPVAAFAAMLAVPAMFVTPGTTVATLPFGVSITEQGIGSASLLAARVITASAIGITLVLTTAWPALLAAFRSMRLPAVVVVILGMTYRYIFVLLRVASEMLTARRSRIVAPGNGRGSRQVLVRTSGVLLARSIDEGERIYQAMLSRGFTGEVRLLEPFRLAPRDWTAMAAAVVLAAALLYWGRS